MKKILVSLLFTINILSLFPSLARGIFLFKKDFSKQIILSTSKKEYLHYEFVAIKVKIRNSKIQKSLMRNNLYALVYKDDKKVVTIGQKGVVNLKYNPDNLLWEGKWPVPWNAEEGEYLIKLFPSQEIIKKGKNKIWETKFFIKRRPLFNLKPGLCIVTFENPVPLRNKWIEGPDGKKGDWREIFEWIKFAGGNTFWYLAGQTASYTKAKEEETTDTFPWIKDNLDFLPEFACMAHRYGIKFGAWVVAYLTFGKIHKELDYDYAWEYNPKRNICFPSRAISLQDKKRLRDIIEFIKYLNNIPEIDYIGIDYIRNALGGYEMVDDFVSEMEVETPSDWGKFSKQERMIWLAKEKIAREDFVLIDQWQWWRARQVALIIHQIRKEVKLNKPLWAFTLSWQKGWQHGQDPVMMNDAGVDIDAVMLYEADGEQFDRLIKDWHKYLGKNHANVIGGNIVDWPLHQYTVNPPGPEEMYNRSIMAIDRLYKDGLSKGAFVHCLSRALWGRRGPYSRYEWMLAGGAIFSRLRERWKKFSLKTKVLAPKEAIFNKVFKVKIKVINLKPTKMHDIKVTLLPQKGIEMIDRVCKKIEVIGPGYEVIVPFEVKINEFFPQRDCRYMIVFRTEWLEKREIQNNISFKYVKAIEIPSELLDERLEKQEDNKENIKKNKGINSILLEESSKKEDKENEQ